MNIIIIEDEKPALEKLRLQLINYPRPVNIVATLSGVQESVMWLSDNVHPDLIFCDIALSDGISFDIFRQVNVKCPVIFITAYDDYLLEAFELNSIDYLLKPVSQERLFVALNKYFQLKEHFAGNYSGLADYYFAGQQQKTRYLVKKGVSYSTVKLEDIAYFISEHKITFLIDKSGNKYILDKTLQELETELPKNDFFRINRKYIGNISAISKFKPFSKGKILVELTPAVGEEVIVSAENAAAFKLWVSGDG